MHQPETDDANVLIVSLAGSTATTNKDTPTFPFISNVGGQDPESLNDIENLSPEEMGRLTKILASMGIKAEEVPGNIITFLAMVGQGLFGGELAFKYLNLGLQSLLSHYDISEKNRGISSEAIAGSTAILITAAVIWGKYKLVRSFNRQTLTVEGVKDFFTLKSKTEAGKALAKLPFVLTASAVFAGLNGVSLDGFSALLLEQSQNDFIQAIAAIATSLPTKWVLGICAFISNYFGFFGIMEYGTHLTLDILFRKNPLFRDLQYTKAEERIIASIRTLKNYTGLLYENDMFTQLEQLLGTLLPEENTQVLQNDNIDVKGLEQLLVSLKSNLDDGDLIENIINQSFTAGIHKDNKILPRTLLRQYGQWILGNIVAGISVVGLSNFFEISTPSIEQLCLMSNSNCTLNATEQNILGTIDYTAMIALAVLSTYNLGYSLLASRYETTVGNLSNIKEAYIMSTCGLGGAPNILQSIIAKQNPAFVVFSEIASALIEYDGFKNIEKQQYLESLKTSEPLLWFMISFHQIMEEAIQKISELSPKDLEKFHTKYNEHALSKDRFQLPENKYGNGLAFWKSAPNKNLDEFSPLSINSNIDIPQTASSSRCGGWGCGIQ